MENILIGGGKREMQEFLFINPVVVPYRVSGGGVGFLGAAFIIVFLIVFFISVGKSYGALKNIPKRFVSTFAFFVVGAIIFVWFGFSAERENQTMFYVFDDEKVCLFESDKIGDLENGVLLKVANYEELTPYFSYKRSSSRRSSEYVTTVNLKLKDGTIFTTFSSYRMSEVVAYYAQIQQRDPEVLERVVIPDADDKGVFQEFKQKVRTEVNSQTIK